MLSVSVILNSEINLSSHEVKKKKSLFLVTYKETKEHTMKNKAAHKLLSTLEIKSWAYFLMANWAPKNLTCGLCRKAILRSHLPF